MVLGEELEVVEEEWVVGEVALRLLAPRDPAAVVDTVAESSSAGPVWGRVWRSARCLAGAVATEGLDGARVVELGCGLGLVSLVAAAGGARVLATDRSPWALAFAATSAERNGLPVETARCDWEEPSTILSGSPWQRVLAADVLYDERAAGLLLALLPRLVDVGGEVLIADPGRGVAGLFFDAAAVDWSIARARLSADVLLYRLRPRRLWTPGPAASAV